MEKQSKGRGKTFRPFLCLPWTCPSESCLPNQCFFSIWWHGTLSFSSWVPITLYSFSMPLYDNIPLSVSSWHPALPFTLTLVRLFAQTVLIGNDESSGIPPPKTLVCCWVGQQFPESYLDVGISICRVGARHWQHCNNYYPKQGAFTLTLGESCWPSEGPGGYSFLCRTTPCCK